MASDEQATNNASAGILGTRVLKVPLWAPLALFILLYYSSPVAVNMFGADRSGKDAFWMLLAFSWFWAFLWFFAANRKVLGWGPTVVFSTWLMVALAALLAWADAKQSHVPKWYYLDRPDWMLRDLTWFALFGVVSLVALFHSRVSRTTQVLLASMCCGMLLMVFAPTQTVRDTFVGHPVLAPVLGLAAGLSWAGIAALYRRKKRIVAASSIAIVVVISATILDYVANPPRMEGANLFLCQDCGAKKLEKYGNFHGFFRTYFDRTVEVRDDKRGCSHRWERQGPRDVDNPRTQWW